jgi:hypothetical protein
VLKLKQNLIALRSNSNCSWMISVLKHDHSKSGWNFQEKKYDNMLEVYSILWVDNKFINK